MTAGTIVMMVLYLVLVWGLLIVAAIHLARNDDRTSGTLAGKDLDELPEYTPPSVS